MIDTIQIISLFGLLASIYAAGWSDRNNKLQIFTLLILVGNLSVFVFSLEMQP